MKQEWNGKRKSRTGDTARGDHRRERRRLVQLAASAALFALALVGRSVFPGQFALWNDRLRHDTDLKAAFAQLGEAASQGEPILETLGKLCVQVFAGGEELRETGGAKIFDLAPAYFVWLDQWEDPWCGD